MNKTFFIKKILPVAAGAILGYSYYYFIGCSSGTCPITSNPFISTAYGAFVGLIFAFPTKKKNKGVKNDNNNQN